MNNEAFQRGFIKAALANGLHPLQAVQLLKIAGPESIPSPTMQPRPPAPSIGSQVGRALANTSSNQLNTVSGLANKFKNFDFGAGTSNLVNNIKGQMSDMAPGASQMLSNQGQTRQLVADSMNHATTNAVPQSMEALQSHGTTALDSFLQQHGPSLGKSFGEAAKATENIGSATTGLDQVLSKYLDRGHLTKPTEDNPDAPREYVNNTNNILAKILTHFTEGSGTNTLKSLDTAVQSGLK